jgi:hypothetical protein
MDIQYSFEQLLIEFLAFLPKVISGVVVLSFHCTYLRGLHVL